MQNNFPRLSLKPLSTVSTSTSRRRSCCSRPSRSRSPTSSSRSTNTSLPDGRQTIQISPMSTACWPRSAQETFTTTKPQPCKSDHHQNFQKSYLQSNSVITITVLTNSCLKQTKYCWIFGPKWSIYLINLRGYNDVTVITNKYGRSHRVRHTEFDCIWSLFQYFRGLHSRSTQGNYIVCNEDEYHEVSKEVI